MSVVLITGCSTGIGYATALLLSKSGHRVYATMRHPDQAPELSQMAQREDLPISVLPLDVTLDASVQDAVSRIVEKEGTIDVLVNNAGVASGGAVEELPFELYHKDMETNYFGTLRCIRAVLPAMRQRGAGCIINISSVAGKIYSNFQSSYCASKAAVEALSESLAQEVHPFGVRVALVEPGVIETPIFSKGNEIPEATFYPNIRRLTAFFEASLQNHVPPYVVATVVKEIIVGNSTQFRNPAGPDALPLLAWRAGTSDEDWVNAGCMDEATWMAGMEQMGLPVKQFFKEKMYNPFKAEATPAS
jgi:NAD(P)-dependent dehydrogenase (short-subunit alcohol dehydrogenase family)